MLLKTESKNSLKTLKFRNRKLVLSFMRGAGAVSVNEISRATGLSKMTVHKIIDYYLEEGMISYSGKGVSTEEGGKKPNLFSFNAECRYIYAVRLGGDFLSTSIVNLKGEMVVGRKTVPLNNVSFTEVVDLIAAAFREQCGQKDLPREQCLATVVGCNGIVDVENGICLAAYQFPQWGVNIPIRQALGAHLPENVPVQVDSWWRHLAHGEMHARGDETCRFYMIGNSGDYISGGLVAEGVVSSGATGFAGEIGHLIIDPKSEAQCACGGKGCLEALVAPSKVLARAVALRGEFPDSSVFAADLTGGLADVGRAADAGDPLGRKIMEEMADAFAIAINNIIHISDPGQILFFGDYANNGEFFFQTLRARVQEMGLHGIDKRTSIEPSKLSEDHGVIGAANHMTDTLFAAGR